LDWLGDFAKLLEEGTHFWREVDSEWRTVLGKESRSDKGCATIRVKEEEICSLEFFGYVFDFPLRLIGSLVLTAEG
jgi:hypothetical protein